MKVYFITFLSTALCCWHVFAFTVTTSHLSSFSLTFPPVGTCRRRHTNQLFGTEVTKNLAETTHEHATKISRREIFTHAIAAYAGLTALSIQPVAAASTDDATAAASNSPIRLSATWSATSGLNALDRNDPNFVSFDPSAYAAMRDDPARTPLFRKSLQARLEASPPESQIVVDLGTGPFALFAIMAAELGAKKVYAIEANPAVAAYARQTIRKQGWEDVVTVLEGFSTDVTLPEKADIIVAEIVGSVASEEGAYATILDAHQRLLKNPTDPQNWIPNRIQTWAAPASYTLHNLFRPPEFDWTKIATEPVRFNCRDLGLALLDDPQCVEDISFADIGAVQALRTTRLRFTASAERMEENTQNFIGEYRKGKLPKAQALELGEQAAHSCTGIAFWPRLCLPYDQIIASRSHPDGGPQRSHWQTVLPIMAATPAAGIQGGDTIEVTCRFETPASVTVAPKYSVEALVYTQPQGTR